MASDLPVFQDFKDNSFKQDFIDKYAKKLKLPQVQTVFGEFHPLLPDYFITVNKIDIPSFGKGRYLRLVRVMADTMLHSI